MTSPLTNLARLLHGLFGIHSWVYDEPPSYVRTCRTCGEVQYLVSVDTITGYERPPVWMNTE